MFLRNLACLFVAMYILMDASPQIGFFGHGLRTGLPCALLGMGAIFMSDGGALGRALRRLRWIIILGLVFSLMSFLRFWGIDDWYIFPLRMQFGVSPLQLLLAFFLFVGILELGPREARLFRGILLFGWTVSLSLGIPWLLSKEGVARLTMGSARATEKAAEWAPWGIASYTGYTAVGICLTPVVLYCLRLGRVGRLLGLVCVAGAALSVLISTFTMATFLLMCNLGALLIYWVIRRRNMRPARAIAAVLISLSIPALLALGSEVSPQFSRAYEKMQRLFGGISSEGLTWGDETHRGAWFVAELQDFISNPVLGKVAGLTDLNFGYQHSSLTNTLVIHGIVGSVWWFGLLLLLAKYAWRSAGNLPDRFAVVVSWTILFMGGILNPAWYHMGIVGPLVIYTLAMSGDVRMLDPDRSPEGMLDGAGYNYYYSTR